MAEKKKQEEKVEKPLLYQVHIVVGDVIEPIAANVTKDVADTLGALNLNRAVNGAKLELIPYEETGRGPTQGEAA